MRHSMLIALLIGAASAASLHLPKSKDLCDEVDCRAGRECLVTGGEAQCLCVTSCPDHDRPVCGSDGNSYDNYCLLHQHACVTGYHIRVGHRGYCKKDVEMAMREFGLLDPTTTTTTRRPTTTTTTTTTARPIQPTEIHEELSVCYGPQRDALRDTIIAHWQQSVSSQPWYTEGMTYKESLSGHFFNCDTDKDYMLKPDELFDCFDKIPFMARPEQDLTVTKTLCVDAVIEEADNNKDWKLDFQEFTYLLDPMHKMVAKNCSLEGKDYTDGAEVRVECNHCVCATGSWVCATHDCQSSTTTTTTEAPFAYADTKYDLKDTTTKKPEDDDDEFYDDDYYDDDYYYDDDEDSDEKESAQKYEKEEAKKEFDALSPSEKTKLIQLEKNIKKFYDDVESMNHLNDVEESSSKTNTEETDEMAEISAEEDEILDKYDELLEKSRTMRDKLATLREALRKLENQRAHLDSNSGSTISSSNHEQASRYQYNHNSLDHDDDTDISFNMIDHDTRPRKTVKKKKGHGAHKKESQIDAYNTALRTKLQRNREVSEVDNDIWEDQWKAKIAKHDHHLNNL